MNGPTAVAEWLACAGIGVVVTAVVVCLMKLALDPAPARRARTAGDRPEGTGQAPQRHLHPAPPGPADEFPLLSCAQPRPGRHRKEGPACS